MSIYYLIDGYNLIETHKERFPGSLRRAREILIELIVKNRPEGSSRNKVTVIFDGQPGINSKSDKRVDIRFTSGKEADWHIKKLVATHSNPKQIIVVTDDNVIKRHVSISGAKTMSTNEFIARLFPEKKRNSKNCCTDKELSPEEIKDINEEFLRKKGLDSNEELLKKKNPFRERYEG